MNKSQCKVGIIELLLIGFLIYAMCNMDSFSRVFLSVILLGFSFIAWRLCKKRIVKSLYSKHVSIWMAIFAAVYLCIFCAF